MTEKEKWIITCAWPYVNTVPHLGTFLHLLSGDVITRYQRIKGNDVVYVSGSDSHGTPIIMAAEKEGISPMELALKYHNIFLDLIEKWNIDFSNYSITENPTHIAFVQEFYKKLHDNNYLSLKDSEQFYCETCKRFLPDRFVEGICPVCNVKGARGDQCTNSECGAILKPQELLEPYCVSCKNTPIIKPTQHWYFELPAFAKELKEYVEKSAHIPANAKPKMLDMIEEGLIERPITRDLDWGVPAGPIFGEEYNQKVLYVWTEAVLGYISAVKEWAEKQGKPELFDYFWKDPKTKTVYCIGKDNNIFHIILFPALLMGSKEPYPLPYAVSTTQFIMFKDEAFSKSKGVGLWADEAVSLLPSDYWRYFLLYTRPELRDSNFDWAEFVKAVNINLNDTVGNFINRTLTFTGQHFASKIPERGELEEKDRKLLQDVEHCFGEYIKAMDCFKLKDATAIATGIARMGNQYLSSEQPWHLIKTDKAKAGKVLNISAKISEILSILLWPIIPETSEKIWTALGFPDKPTSTTIGSVDVFKDLSGQTITTISTLFFKVKEQELLKKLADVRSKNTSQKEKKIDAKKKKDETTSKGEKQMTEEISYEEFQKVKLKVGTIKEAEALEKSKNLVKLKVDLGEDEFRQVLAGIKQYYPVENLVGKQVVIVTNLKPAKLMGQLSQGMMLAADVDGEPIILNPDKEVPVGSIVR